MRAFAVCVSTDSVLVLPKYMFTTHSFSIFPYVAVIVFVGDEAPLIGLYNILKDENEPLAKQ